MVKAIIFDMDGVLIDSTRYVFDSFNELLKNYGVYIKNEHLKKYLGISLRDQIKMWKKDYNLKENLDLKDFSHRAFKIQIKLMEKGLKGDKKIKNLIQSLKSSGLKLAVATSSKRFRANKILELLGIKNKLDAIVTADDVENHKPNPDVFLKAAEKLKIDPKDCVVVEDAVNGIEGAKKGNMKAIAILTEFQQKEDFKDADLILNNIYELNMDKINDLH